MSWPTAVDAQGWMRKTERRIGLLERKPVGSSDSGGGGSTTLTVQDTATLDLTLTGSSAVGYTLKGDVIGGGSGGGGSDGKIIPAGVIVPWSGTGAVPSGWLLADGSAVSRTVYSDLFAAVGTTYGVGDNTTTFNLPDLRSRVPVGLNVADPGFDWIGRTGGEKAHTLTIAEMPSHHHSALDDGFVFKNTIDSGSFYWPPAAATNRASLQKDTTDTGGGGAHNNLQPYITQRYLISIGKGGSSSGSRGVVGEIIAWTTATAPQDHLLCDGSAVSRTTYGDLFAVIGTTYGVGDNSTTFNLPNLKGRGGMGLDASQTEFNALGKMGGEKAHVQTLAEMAAHAHDVYYQGGSRAQLVQTSAGDSGGSPNRAMIASGTGTPYLVTETKGSGSAANVLDPYLTLNYAIRFRTTLGVNDTKMAVTDTTTIDLTLTGDGSPVTPYTVQADVKMAAILPPGFIMITASGGALAAGWLYCQGQAVSRTTYAALFAAVGTTYGVGDNSTTFNLPDLRGRVVVMADAAQAEFGALGTSGGEKTHVLTVPEMPSHAHQEVLGQGAGTNVTANIAASLALYGTTVNTSPTGGGGAHNNLQPYLSLYYMIKT